MKAQGEQIDGLLVIDKPAGITSHDVVQQVRRWAGQRRVGHLGTLDPRATGVLPIALGEATKLSQLLTLGRKGYRGTIELGVETTTYDGEGEVTAHTEGPWPDRETVEKCVDRFRGEIEQVPPPYSAVKQSGEAAYRRARRGEVVTLEPRPVTFYEIELLRYEPPSLEIEVECSAGTYLRSLAHDLGAELGTFAHLSALVRSLSGPFSQAGRTGEGSRATRTMDPGGSVAGNPPKGSTRLSRRCPAQPRHLPPAYG